MFSRSDRSPRRSVRRETVWRWLIRWHMDTQDIPYHRERIPRAIRHDVLRRDGTVCRYCGIDCRSEFDLDHVYPSSLGGETSVENLVVACRPCNRTKGARVGIWPKPVRYFHWRGRLGRWLIRRLQL
jgi:5-methylcytosine-specific restriction endonuclease McrA